MKRSYLLMLTKRSKTFFSLVVLCLFLWSISVAGQNAELRRPITPEQPMWLVHIDTWTYPDPQKIIDLIPEDIRPFVIFNIGLSTWDHSTNNLRVVKYGYETAKSWIRVCAENQVWVVVQPSSGGSTHFPDYDQSVDYEETLYAEFFRDYPNFLGFNYCEQFWGYDQVGVTPSAIERYIHFVSLLELSNKYGGYLINSFCPNRWNANINAIAMLKRIPAWEEVTRNYGQNYLFFEKYTQRTFQYEMEIQALGAYLSGYSGGFGVRYDDTGWTDSNDSEAKRQFTLSTGLAPIFERFMLNGMTMIDGPELIFEQSFRELERGITDDGYTFRRWDTYPQFKNVYFPMFRKVLDGTVRIPTRQEVIDRTKYVIIQDVNSGIDQARYLSPPSLFQGLYRMDGDGNHNENRSFYKKTGRYPAIPLVFGLNDEFANSFEYQIKSSEYSSRWPAISSKVAELNSVFEEEYTGDIFAGRHENGWVLYNPYKEDKTASGSIPFQYNTADRMELTFSRYTTGIVREYNDQLVFHLNNYDIKVDNRLRTNTIKVYGSTDQPSFTYRDIGKSNQMPSEVSSDWSNGVFTLTIQQNGPIDITVNCSGTETERLTSFTPANVRTPNRPPIYTGPRQYETEIFEYKNIARNVPSGIDRDIDNYTGQGYVEFGTNSGASIRKSVTAQKTGEYNLTTKYSVIGGDVNTIDLYVNGELVTTPTFTQTSALSDWDFNNQIINLNEGSNVIEFRANATGARTIYFDNIVITTTEYEEMYPVALYTFDQEIGSEIPDVSGNANTATANGEFSFVPGNIGNAIKLYGSDAYVFMPTGILSTVNDFTISTWVNLEQVDTWSRIFDFGTDTDVNMYLTPQSDDGNVRFSITNDGTDSEQHINGSEPLPINKWIHVAVTLSGNKGTLYVNGLPVGSNTNMTLSPSDLGNTDNNYLGRSQHADPYLTGQIDQFDIYNYAFTAVQIADLYHQIYPANRYTLTSLVNGRGTVYPAYATYNEGTSINISIMPEPGWQLDNWSLVGSGDTGTSSKISINMDSDKLVIANFSEVPIEQIALYTFDQESGSSIPDASGNGNTATAYGDFSFVEGKAGNAIDLNGSDAYVAVPSGILSSTHDFSITAWVNLDQINVDSRLFDFSAGADAYMYLNPRSSNNTVRFGITTQGAGGEQFVAGSHTIRANTWYHVAVTLSGNTGTIYVNGSPVGSNASMTLTPSDLGNTLNNYIGRSHLNSFLDGQIDQFHIYNNALTASKIAEIYNQENPTNIMSLATKEVRVYPNPVSNGKLNIELSGMEGTSLIRVFNVSGNLIKEKQTRDNHSTQLDVKDLIPGMYIIQIINNDHSIIKQFLIK